MADLVVERHYFIDGVEVSEAQAEGFAERHGLHVGHALGRCCDHYEDSLEAERLTDLVTKRGFCG